jgi:hypothetical protein
MPPTPAELELIRKLNEPGGKLFELLSYLMLEEASGEKVTFQPRPTYMLINPDLAIGKESAPIVLALVTHATAKNAAGVKVDRNIEELFEAKTLSPLNNIPKVINFIWHSPVGWADGHIARLENAFDFTWIAFRDCKAYTSLLPTFVKLSADIVALNFKDSLDVIKKAGILKKLLLEFSPLFRKNILTTKIKHGNLWTNERKRVVPYSSKSPFAVNNRVKLDLMSLMLVPLSSLSLLLKGKSEKTTPLFDSAIMAGSLVNFRSLVKNEVSISKDLQFRLDLLIRTLGIDTLVTALTGANDTEGFNSLTTAFEPENLTEKRVSLLRMHSTKGTLYDLIQESWNKTSLLYNGRCWVIEFAVTIIKTKLRADYGLLTVQREALGDSRLNFGWDLLFWYVTGKRKSLTEPQLRQISKIIESYINKISSKTNDLTLSREVRNWLIKELRKKKQGNPLPWLVKTALTNAGIKSKGFPETLISRACPFATLSGLKSTSGLSLWHILAEKKIIHILSSYSSTHKHKEYSAKARVANYVAGGGLIQKDTAISEIGIILDGIWSESEVNMFQKAGVNIFSMDNPSAWLKWAS